MIDFERNYRIRRAIFQALQQSQKSESQAAERSRQVAIQCKRDMLLLFSKWLLELNSASAVSDVERQEIQSLTRVSLDMWIQLQIVAVEISKGLKEAQGKEKEANAALQKKTPFGTATKLFADTESKMQIRDLQNSVASAQKYRENMEARLTQNAADRRTLGDAFLRDCLKQFDKIASTKAFGREAEAILSRISKETNALWVRQTRQHIEEFDQIAKLIAALRGSYKDGPASSPEGNRYDLSER
jgi:hypothetical protein